MKNQKKVRKLIRNMTLKTLRERRKNFPSTDVDRDSGYDPQEQHENNTELVEDLNRLHKRIDEVRKPIQDDE